MSEPHHPIAIVTDEVTTRVCLPYPEPFASRLAGRDKRAISQAFGLGAFGVYQTRLAPGAISALRHSHTLQDEFVYVLSGHPVLRTRAGDTQLAPGMCAGFRAGSDSAHQLINPGDQEAVLLEVDAVAPGDEVTYPCDDLVGQMRDGQCSFTRKDGTPY